MITKHPWFAPKRIGWGWRPVSWEGWLVTVLSAAVVVTANIAFGAAALTLYLSAAAIAALVIVCLLTGTRPG